MRKLEAAAIVIILAPSMLILYVMALVLIGTGLGSAIGASEDPTLLILGCGIGCLAIWAGFVLFVIAKLSGFKRGVWVSFGSEKLTPYYQRLYRCGYALMVLGVLTISTLSVIAGE